MPNYKLSRRKKMACFAEVASITAYPLHSHEYYELELVQGNGCHNVVDGTDFIVNGTSCFLYMPYTRHYYYSENGGGAQISRIGFAGSFLPADFMNLILSDNAFCSIVLPEGQEEDMKRCFTEILSMYFGDREDPFCELYLKAMIGRLVVRFYELRDRTKALSAPLPDDAMRRVCAYIQNHFNKQLSLAELADIAGMSAGYFSRYFRQATGMTYSHYVNGIRMNYAVSLLKMTDYSLKKISEETGYYSESGFIKSFTKYFGFHPDTFRVSAQPVRKKEESPMQPLVIDGTMPVPIPKQYKKRDETILVPPVIYAHTAYTYCAEVLKDYIRRLFHMDCTSTSAAEKAGILFVEDPALPEETYHINAADGQVRITASSTAGFSHGGAVFLQMAESVGNAFRIHSFTIEDTPDISWRGFMVDLARGSYPVFDILRYADICYFYRLRVLHLHFTDAPGDSWYKLPSKRFPKLERGETYSIEDIEKIKKYLHDRGILVLPEIEMPGHARPLVANYPENFGGTHNDTVCPGKEGVFAALDTLIGEVCDLFPDAPYIHIGCDEVQHTTWDTCPECQAFMRKMRIPSSAALYTYMVDRCTRMVLDKGRTPVVWEGFPKEGSEKLSREIVVMVFQSTYQTAISLTEAGFRVINTSWQPLYIVPSRPKYWHPSDIYCWKYNRWLYEDAIDDKDPMDVEKTELVLGGEICLWEGQTYEKDGAIVEENMAVLAERLWNKEPICDYTIYEKYKKAAANKLFRMLGTAE